MYEFDLDTGILKMYLRIKMEFCRPRLSKDTARTGQTNKERETDTTERITIRVCTLQVVKTVVLHTLFIILTP